MSRSPIKNCLGCLAVNWKFLTLLLSPIVLLPVALLGHSVEFRCAYVILLMAVYWVTEAIPLAVTALIPVFAFPLFGILSTQAVTSVYLKDTNFMFMGGLIMAVAVEHCNLHKRIALSVIIHIGQSARRLLAGFMLTTMFLSMWISNTAAAAMLVPIVDAVAKEFDKTMTLEDDPMKRKKAAKEKVIREEAKTSRLNLCDNDAQSSVSEVFKEEGDLTESSSESWTEGESRAMRKMLFLGVAFAANIGGTGSPLGCGPNLVVFSVLQSTFGEGTGLNFATWMMFNVPGMLLCVTLGWFWLQIVCRTKKNKKRADTTNANQEQAIKSFLEQQYKALGHISQHELVVLISFTSLVFLWIFRAPGFINGWAYYISNSYENKVLIRDATPVMFMVVLLFCIPKSFKRDTSGSKKSHNEACLTWQVVQQKTPWGIILLLGGGLAMAEGAKVSGLSVWIGHQLSYFEVMPKEAIVFIICLMTAMLTEVASNTATASVLLPVIKDLSLAINVNPLYLMLPAAVCCAYAFMLPVATPGNAIILTAAGLKTHEMIRAGLVMNILCVAIITVMINTLGVLLFDLHTFPDWAANITAVAT